jgi:hypothetical protein
MRKNLAFVLAAAALVSGCATMPERYDVENARSYNQSYDEVWEKIINFFSSHHIQVKNIAKDSGVIYAETTSFDYKFADCGTGGLMVPFARSALINVFVSRAVEQPKVTVNTEFKETRRFGDATKIVTCNSKGAFEKAVLDAIKEDKE